MLWRSFGNGGHIGEWHALAFEESLFHAAAPFDEAGNVGFDNGRNVRRHFFDITIWSDRMRATRSISTISSPLAEVTGLTGLLRLSLPPVVDAGACPVAVVAVARCDCSPLSGNEVRTVR